MQFSEKNSDVKTLIHGSGNIILRLMGRGCFAAGEESAGYTFTPSDAKTSFDLAMYSMDEATWPAMLLEYVMSLHNCPDSVLAIGAVLFTTCFSDDPTQLKINY